VAVQVVLRTSTSISPDCSAVKRSAVSRSTNSTASASPSTAAAITRQKSASKPTWSPARRVEHGEAGQRSSRVPQRTGRRRCPDRRGRHGPIVDVEPVPRQLGLNRAGLDAHGFTGKVGSTLVVPSREGSTLVAVGVGDAPGPKQLRDAAAAFVRAAGKRAHLATNLVEHGADAGAAAQAVTEGILLANYRYLGLKTDRSGASVLDTVSLVVGQAHEKAAGRGAQRGEAAATAANLAREFANMPPNALTARTFAARAQELASECGLTVEVYDRDQLATMGCGGMVGVNAGSTEPPRMVKLTYTPRNPKAHVALVGKGVMYDSGGLSLKPTNPMSVAMKMDMSGAAAVLSAMTALKALGCKNRVSAWLMCTDNMPSGSALKLGDVLTFRNGKTAEIHNTDAEGRLVLADGCRSRSRSHPTSSSTSPRSPARPWRRWAATTRQ
jgi:leucyl aminopeptidase